MGARVPKFRIGDRYISQGVYDKHQKYNAATGCTEWIGVTNSIGYPFIGYTSESKPQNGMMTAHRIALALKLGRDLLPGMNANHTCHNRLCMTPEHLEEGTQTQKRADMVRDGIAASLVGNNHGYTHKQHGRKYRYSEADIQWVRNANLTDIAARYNLTRTKASSMRSMFRTGYKWLPWDKN